ncbi:MULTISPECIES: 5-fold beta-flower protein [unclassified Saccharibacter]|uniref:5-fold beta-flower protein n=1 Tax=unclassified Saccharibacter TaxID=2648722 RepID=UPI00132C2E41|nr:MULTISPECIES: hypothetical protein [unclassified Saccharibacter]MXV36840.1 hypothetical protein [Saccharibacter sp. EH611]MXV58670.1 hypothetical protein [Saccharibacter sp. EH70]MXV66176.1 hypothetical protein [Saccharibacter sp. EH60]
MINKYLFIAAIFCIPFLIGNSFSQSGPIYSADSDPIGKITNDGDILGSNGILLGSLSKSGIIYSADSDPIGRITNDGDILGSNGILLGSLSKSGIIYSADSDPIGRVTNDGDILGSNGILIATAPDPQVGALMLLHVINLH